MENGYLKPSFPTMQTAWQCSQLFVNHLSRICIMELLLDLLKRLERELHHPGLPGDHERLEALLHPEFCEVGRSGLRYSRETVVRYLASVEAPVPTASDQFAVIELAADFALLTYRSWQPGTDGSRQRPSLRSSLWQRSQGQWQLRYHQGTPAAESEMANS